MQYCLIRARIEVCIGCNGNSKEDVIPLPRVQNKIRVNTKDASLVWVDWGCKKQVQRHRDKCFQETASTWLCEEHRITGKERWGKRLKK